MPEEHRGEAPLEPFLFSPGKMVGRYKMVRKIGAGGMGQVYLADDTELNRQVALKFLPYHHLRDENVRARFRREAQAAAKLNHPNIVTIHEVGEYNTFPYIVMEYIEGKQCQEIIQQKQLPYDQVLDFAIQICRGLNDAHEAGIVHRDIKPSNILMDNKGRCRILDFGIAKVSGVEKLTKTGSTVGTIGYVSPELLQAKIADRRSDIFSLGVVLYELITGQQPFYKDSEAATLHAILHENPQPLSSFRQPVPNGLQNIIDRALMKDPQSRYQSADDMLGDLLRVKRLVESGRAIPSDTVPMTPTKKQKRYRLIVPVVIAILFLLLVIPGNYRTVMEWTGLDSVKGAKHLAVIPFVNIGEKEEQTAFCDGLSEILSSKLTQIENVRGPLWVIPAREVRDRGVTSAQQARVAFGASLVVTGSVQYFDNLVRLSINLVDAENARQVKSIVADADLNDISALQDSVVFWAADMLGIELTPANRRLLAGGKTVSSRAYNLYLQGKGYLQSIDEPGNIDTAIALFKKALAADQDYTQAYAGLGEAYWRKFKASEESRWVEIAVLNCNRALEIDDRLPQVHLALGLIYNGTGQYEKAEASFKQSLELDPHFYDAYRGLASAYEGLNKFDEAESTYREAVRLRPDYWGGYFDIGYFYYLHGYPPEALEELQLAKFLAPEAVYPYNDLGGLFFALDKRQEARRMWEKSLQIGPNYAAFSNLASLAFMEQRYEDAARMYTRALEIDDRNYRVWGNLGYACYWLPGRRKEALTIYQRAINKAEELREVNPRDLNVLCNLAEYNALSGHIDTARFYMEQALDMTADNVEAQAMAVSVYEIIGDRNQALEWAEKALASGYPGEYFKHLPELESLVADPQFEQLLDEYAEG